MPIVATSCVATASDICPTTPEVVGVVAGESGAWVAAGTLVAIFLLARPEVLRYRAANDVALVAVPEVGVAFEAYEVTNERYGWCMEAGVCDRADRFAQIEADWDANSQLPVVGVDAADAMTFCRWIGRMPPTVEEWATVAPPLEAWRTLGPDEALLAYQYLQMLPQLAKGDANKVWIIPSELTDALRGVSSALGGNGGGGGGGGGFDEEWVEPAPAPAAAPPIQRAREFGDPEVIGDAQPH